MTIITGPEDQSGRRARILDRQPSSGESKLWARRAAGRLSTLVAVAYLVFGTVSASAATLPTAPSPFESNGRPVDWIFVFKLNAATFPSAADGAGRACGFGGSPQAYSAFSQQYAVASSVAPVLRPGDGLLGSGGTDPLSTTFAGMYNGKLHYVVWNDQFYRHPEIKGCAESCSAPWGHSKGIVAWNDAGEGVLLQVTTPSWPASGSADHPREDDGNTLGCIDDNNVKVSQDFFALRLTEDDLEKVLDAIANASVVTDPTNIQIVSNGGPEPISSRVAKLGVRSNGTSPTDVLLSTGVRLLSKPSRLNVPPWQFVSSVLGGVDLRVATWWANPQIPSTPKGVPACWDPRLATPGAVTIATSGSWAGKTIGLKGGPFPDANHAKVGVSVSGKANYTIFGDMNQQGALAGNCASSQNGRGGLFLVVDNAALNSSVADLITGGTAPFVAPVPADSGTFASLSAPVPPVALPPGESLQPTDVNAPSDQLQVTAFSLNCRATNSGKAKIVLVLKRGDEVLSIERKRTWTLVKSGDARCWVAGRFLSAEATL